jgi:biotin carboxylase
MAAQGCGLLAANQRLPQLLRAKHIGFMGPSVQTMARLNSQVRQDMLTT